MPQIPLQPAISPDPRNHPEANRVLTEALLAAVERLGISQVAAATMVGISPSKVSRMAKGQAQLQANAKEGEMTLLLLRLYRSLLALLGGNEQQARQWLHGPHQRLGRKPIEMIQTTEGLVRVVDYLDALRGQ